MTLPILLAGASGYSFKEWKGVFYPDSIRSEDMLKFYADRLPTVEINSSYYQMPKPAGLQKWVAATPDSFIFSIKVPQQITHRARLDADLAAAPLRQLYETLETLGAQRGPVLFQLPPYLKKDLRLLADFLALLPPDHRAVFEFRHESWFNDEVYQLLRQHHVALCLSERENALPPPLIETADWAYLRLRLERYSERELTQWVERLAASSWQRAYVYFMHEATAPAYAQTLMRIAGS